MSGVGYNPYRKANGEFASKDEVGDIEAKVTEDLRAAEQSGDAERVEHIEQYIEEKLYDTPTGTNLLEKKYGTTASATSDEHSFAQHTKSLDEQNGEELRYSTNQLMHATHYLDSRGFDVRDRHAHLIAADMLHDDDENLRKNLQIFQQDMREQETNFIRAADDAEYRKLVNIQEEPTRPPQPLSADEEAEFQQLKKEARELYRQTEQFDDRGVDLRQLYGPDFVYSLSTKDTGELKTTVHNMRVDVEEYAARARKNSSTHYGVSGAVLHEDKKALDLQVGDVIHGQKFVGGQWVDDNSEPITQVKQIVTWDHKRAVQVEYADNTTAVFPASSALSFLRKEDS